MKNEKVRIERNGIVHTLNIDENGKPIPIKKDTEGEYRDNILKPIKRKILTLGDSIISYSLIQMVILPLYMIFFKEQILGAFFVPIFFAPMLISGIQIKKTGYTDIEKIKKNITFLIIYSMIIVLFSMLGGSVASILLIVLLFQLFKTRKAIKSVNPKTLKELIEKDIASAKQEQEAKKSPQKRNSKRIWIIISILLAVSFIIFIIAKKIPTFLTPDKSDNFSEEFVINYKDNIPDGWNIMDIENLGLIAIPKTLEVRKEGSTIDVISKDENVYKLLGIEKSKVDNKIVIQQAGLNDSTKESFSTYARVMINTYNFEDGEVPRRYERLNLSTEDLNTIKDLNFSEIEESVKILNCKIEDKTVKEIYINQMNSFKFSFLRKCGNKPPVYVEQYKFFNYNQIIEIILSYRTNDSDMWKNDFSRIIDTFILTN